MRQIVYGKNERLGEAPAFFFVGKAVLLYLFQDFLVGVGRGDLLFDFGGVELPFVLQEVKLLCARLRVYDADLLAFFEEHALHADVGIDRDSIIINQEAFADRSFIFITVYHVFEVTRGMCGGGSRQADFDGVEVIQRLSPDGGLRGGISPVAFIGDDEVEGMDGDIELLRHPRQSPHRPG